MSHVIKYTLLSVVKKLRDSGDKVRFITSACWLTSAFQWCMLNMVTIHDGSIVCMYDGQMNVIVVVKFELSHDIVTSKQYRRTCTYACDKSAVRQSTWYLNTCTDGRVSHEEGGSPSQSEFSHHNIPRSNQPTDIPSVIVHIMPVSKS